ncbi:MAG: Glu-tRNA(Gln) amidotransferase subunit GatE [bacterium]|nr:Glu-tRNA(Gln) amidotransferase subunit GatE [bacterium]
MNDVSRYDPLQGAPLPVLGAWGEDEYQSLGLMSGLEVHQQLQTSKKLFCRCPAGRYTGEHHAEILRHMRPTLSEMGDYDGTALMEFKTRKNITYLLNDETVCTYEMDDAPPFEMNPEALDHAVRVSLMLGLQVVDEIHIARKQYLDGSIPTGFQRTAIIGVQGAVPYRGRRIGIRQLSIEEDSCREVSDRGHSRVYRTDRLGMPLIETVTDPDMHTPWDVAAVCDELRRLARASGLVRTGVGAARQDVNVSIRGGSRVEIKGVPSIKRIPRLVHNEALRQRSLLAIRDVLRERGVTAESLPDASRDVTSIVQGAEGSYLREAVAGGARVMAVPLPGFEGLVSTPTQPHTRFLKEFSDRVRVVACIDTLPNVICSTSEISTLSSAEWGRIERACGVGRDTPIMVVWGDERDARTAAGEILLRAREACEGVPEETRQALPDDTTGFERVLPGPSRMYPDTDLPPVVLAADRLARLAADLPPPPWERRERLRRDGVGEDLADRLARHPAYDLYAHLHPRLGDGPLSATGLASLLLDRDLPRPSSVPAAGAWWERALDELRAGRVLPEAIWWSDGDPAAALPPREARAAFDAAWAEAAAAPPSGLPEADGPRRRAIMGRVMPALRGRVSGRQAAAWLEEATS